MDSVPAARPREHYVLARALHLRERLHAMVTDILSRTESIAERFLRSASQRVIERYVGGLDDERIDDLTAVTKKLGFRQTHLYPDDGFGIAWFEREAVGVK